MVKHIQTIRRQFADELFEGIWSFCEAGAYRVKNPINSFTSSWYKAGRIKSIENTIISLVIWLWKVYPNIFDRV